MSESAPLLYGSSVNINDDRSSLMSELKVSKFARIREIAVAFLPMGFISFGGPQLHMALAQKKFVEGQKWITERVYTEVLALMHALPGPTSTQVITSVGALRGGFLGGLTSLAFFLLPGFVFMTTIGMLSNHFMGSSGYTPPWWLSAIEAGLGSAAVSLVGTAAFGLGKKMATDPMTRLIAIFAAMVTAVYQSDWIFPALFVFSAIVSYVRFTYYPPKEENKDKEQSNVLAVAGLEKEHEAIDYTKTTGTILFALFGIIFIILEVLRRTYPDNNLIQLMSIFWRAGALVFGGGQVVVPMLLAQLSQAGLLTSQQFVNGFAVVQLLPGPVFNVAAYVGAVVEGLPGAVCCNLAMFAPGILLVFAAIPFWRDFRKLVWVRRTLVGLNACAVGLVLGAFLVLWMTLIKNDPYKYLVAVLATGLSVTFNLEPYWIIAIGAIQGIITGAIQRGNGYTWP